MQNWFKSGDSLNLVDLYVKKFMDLIEIERRCEMDFHKNEIIKLGKRERMLEEQF